MGRGQGAADAVKRDEPRNLTFIGMQGMLDPPREAVPQAVDDCHEAGIRVVMVTGDHQRTASAIAQKTHLDRPALKGEPHEYRPAEEQEARSERDELPPARTGTDIADMEDEELDNVLGETNVFARVAPKQKHRLVGRLKENNEIVAVTGDGVNDAPALKSAHIGAAMGAGTDVAKQASDMVITDNNFASVYAAVEEGRTAFRNIRMATFFLLSTGAADVLIILSALAVGWPLPLLPAQILWCNVVTNGIADVALAFEPGEKALFQRPPRPPGEGILDRTLLERLVIVGIWLAAGTLGMFWWLYQDSGSDLTLARTAALTTLILFQKVHVFNCRSEDVSIFKKSLLANKLLFIGVLTSLALHIAALYIPVTQALLRVKPLSGTTWLVAIGIALTAVIVNELHKKLRPARRDRHRQQIGDAQPAEA
jgi:Ca2+-transporting ATPase